ncbi:MAG: MFS transporter [Verrucomicrobiae bacterium]|nr:MFS transporter [Verrucomicrobiae bacterium]
MDSPTKRARLTVLTLGHATVDCYGGLLAPLIPALARHLHVEVCQMAMLFGGLGVFMNLVQPVAGYFTSHRRFPAFLATGPLLATVVCLVGFTESYLVASILFLIGHLGVGIYHPPALMAAQEASGKRQNLGVSIFLSGGFLGVSIAGVAATQWVAHYQFQYFWLFAAPGVLLALALMFRLPGSRAVFASGEHPAVMEHSPSQPFSVIMTMASLMAASSCLLMAFLAAHMEACFGREGFLAGGVTLLLLGISSAAGSYFWGYLAHRVGRFKLLAAGQFLALPFYAALTHAPSVRAAMILSIPTGLCMGGAFFPLVANAARHARGLTPGLRTGLLVGGSWGFGSMITILAGFANQHGVAIPAILTMGLLPMPFVAILSARMAKRDKNG